MDPRHPQHPFSRSTGSSYSHAPFQSTTNQSSLPPASHPQPTAPAYQEHQRRTSDNSYYPSQPSYARDGAPMPNSGHTRHTSTSSIGHGTAASRGMPPPTSPPQQHQSQPPHVQHSHAYPPPSISRGPATHQMQFPTNRDLPSISSLHRPSASASSMSISAMLGAPTPASREQSQSTSQYATSPSVMASAGPSSSSAYGAPVHASPRLSVDGPDYAHSQYRRPQTPEHQRPHESQIVTRDHRANSAGSPARGPLLNTPDANRYGTTQTYAPRGAVSQHTAPPDDRREQYPVRVPNPNSAVPPRPSSQPTMYGAPASRIHEQSRLAEETRRHDPVYGRSVGYGEREDSHTFRDRSARLDDPFFRRDRERMDRERMERDRLDRERAERDRLERDRLERDRLERDRIERDRIERDRIERDRIERDRLERDRLDRERMERREQSGPSGYASMGREVPAYGRPYGQSTSYGGDATARDTSWSARQLRAAQELEHQERSLRLQKEQQTLEQQPTPGPPPTTMGYEYPRTNAQSYLYGNQESRYGPGQFGTAVQPAASAHFDGQAQDRQRMGTMQPQQPQQQQPQQQQQTYSGNQVSGTGSYRLNESPRSRSNDDSSQIQRGAYLGLQQEINRKGRNSPFPQAVQGAQTQHNGPGGEPGIKMEFGKMFSGIGSGVGSSATAGVSSGGAQSPFSNPGQPRRDELDGASIQEIISEIGGSKIARPSSRGARRRRLKDDDGRVDDDSSGGRRTPSGRPSKRPKGVINPPHRHSQNSRQDPIDVTSSPPDSNVTPFKGGVEQGDLSIASLEKEGIRHHHHINRHHHHHHHDHHSKLTPTTSTVPTTQTVNRKSGPAITIIPKPKQVVRSQAVLDSVADRPRTHLGHITYKASLKAGVPPSSEKPHVPRRGFASTPVPLPRLEGQENCTLTVRIPRVHLTPGSRQEITSRRPVWGSDIYTDDSDVIAACIHAGWFRGEWPEDVDVSALDLVVDVPTENGVNTNGNGTDRDAVNWNTVVVMKKDISLTEPPRGGPMIPPSDRDLLVTILILPPLEKYASTTCWGIRSRAWSKTHDGLSFMIMKIKWVDGVDTMKELRGKQRRERMNASTDGWQMDSGESTGNVLSAESFIRGSPGPLDELTGLGMKGWWKQSNGASGTKVDVKIEQEEDQERSEVLAAH